jgi:hypothetical protein
MYVVAECTTLLVLSALIGSLLLGTSVVLLMVQEGASTGWRVFARNRRRRLAARGPVGSLSLTRAPIAVSVKS